jgi:Mn-containing catalase
LAAVRLDAAYITGFANARTNSDARKEAFAKKIVFSRHLLVSIPVDDSIGSPTGGKCMFLHNPKMMFTVRVDQPNPEFAKMLLEQFGGPNGELAAALRYFTQGWAEPDAKRQDMLLSIATEELSHLEMVGQTLVQLLKGTPGPQIDEIESGYLGDLLDGKQEKFVELSMNSGETLLGGSGPRLTDSMGHPFNAACVDTIGEPTADLRSNIAAEARAKLVYERLIKLTNDSGCRQTLGFLMTREIAHQKMFEAALDAITRNFPPGRLQGDRDAAHIYFNDSQPEAPNPEGFQLAARSDWGFNLRQVNQAGAEPPPLPPRKRLESNLANPAPAQSPTGNKQQ